MEKKPTPREKHDKLVSEADSYLAEVDEVLEAETLFYNWITTGRSKPDRDDPLATPLYTEPDPRDLSILE